MLCLKIHVLSYLDNWSVSYNSQYWVIYNFIERVVAKTMCGRFILQGSWAELHQMFNLIQPEDKARNVGPRYNIAPTQDILLVYSETGMPTLKEGRWWLVPHWAKEMPKYAMFNARSEEAEQKPAFRDAFKSSRCLIPADGYIEWTINEDDGKKDPHIIHLPGFEGFAFAGLWAYNAALDITSCTILTAAASTEISHLHHRMPIILKQNSFTTWLDDKISVQDAKALLL